MSSVIQCRKYTGNGLLRKQLLCQVKAAAALGDAQILVASDITENKKLNKDRHPAC